ncbi:hypothetical protein TNCV_3842331 [Trichonephila clavipes]|nr:hypothetical protein TNCV_3842331 [Trichonephila clavipes]
MQKIRSRFHTTGSVSTQPFILTAVGRYMSTKLAWGLKTLGVSHQTDHLIRLTTSAPDGHSRAWLPWAVVPLSLTCVFYLESLPTSPSKELYGDRLIALSINGPLGFFGAEKDKFFPTKSRSEA